MILFIFFKQQMSSGEESGNEASHEIVVLDDLRQWSVKNLKAWLKQRNRKISGNKDVLATRVYKLMNYVDSASSVEDSSSDEGSSISNIPTSIPTSWKSVSTEDIPPIREHDVKNHFLYTKNPVSGHKKNFSRQLQKSRKMYKENYISNVEIGDDHTGVVYIRGKCRASMTTSI